MIRIGIVGNIGSGKSYVAKKFGYPVFNADDEVGKLYKKSRKLYKKLQKILPNYVTSFPIKKTKLAEAIVNDSRNLKKITQIVHPEIRVRMNKFISKNKKKKLVVLDIPLLLENKINKKNDIIIFVEAKKRDIEKRFKKTKKNRVKFLKKFQLPVEMKKKKADFIIKNNFKNSYLEKGVKMILKKILKNA